MNIVKFKKITSFALLFFTYILITITSLKPFPNYHARLYNKNTNQTLDLIGDVHIPNDSKTYSDTCNSLTYVLDSLNPTTTSFIWESPDNQRDARHEEEISYGIKHGMFLGKFALKHLANRNFIASDIRPIDFKIIFHQLSPELLSINPNLKTMDRASKDSFLEKRNIKKIVESILNRYAMQGCIIPRRAFYSVNFNYLRYIPLEKFSDLSNMSLTNQNIFSEELQTYNENVQRFFNMFELNQPNLNGFTSLLQHILRLLSNHPELNLEMFITNFSDLNDKLFKLQILKNIFTQWRKHLIIYAGTAHCLKIKTTLTNSPNLNFKIVFEINKRKAEEAAKIFGNAPIYSPIHKDHWEKLLENPREQIEESNLELEYIRREQLRLLQNQLIIKPEAPL